MSLPAPIPFSLAFIRAMRRSRWLRYHPTVRRAMALAQILSVRRLRLGTLTGDDYLDCAVLVTPPEDKAAAKEAALDALTEPIQLKVKSGPFADREAAAEILAEMELAERIESSSTLTQLDDSIEELLADPDFADITEDLGGVDEARARFRTGDALRDAATSMLKQSMGAMDETEFAKAVKLGLASTIAKESTSKTEALAASVVLGDTELDQAVEAAANFDLQLKLLNLLKSAKVEIADQAQKLADQASTLHELAAVSACAHVQIDRDKLFDALSQSIPGHSFEDLFERTGQFSQDLADQARKALYENYPELDETQLSQHARLSSQWKDALKRAVETRADKLGNVSFDEGITTLKDLYAVTRSQGDPVLSQHLLEGVQGAAAGVVKQAKTLDDLLELIEVSDQMGCRLPPDLLREQGYEIGLDRHEVDSILYSRLSLLKRMIEDGVTVYERFSKLIFKERPSAESVETLAEAALRRQNMAALGALANYNLEWAMRGANALGQGHETVVQSLAAGSGSDMLIQWFRHRNSVPEKVKRPLRRLAREVLIQFAVSLGKELVGDRSQGLLEGEAVRSYVPGDDPSLVDVEESLENIISQGKTLRSIASEDLRVRETTHGRRAIALLVDISGSMHGEKLTWCSIAAVMLAYALRPDELALAFFESDTHVVKTFEDDMEIEEVADELLNLTSQGGTMLGRATQWIAEELRDVGHRRKNALILTDAAIYDLEECAPSCRLLASLNASTIWFVPEDQWARDEATTLASWSKGTVVRLHDNWQRFPQLISEAIR